MRSVEIPSISEQYGRQTCRSFVSVFVLISMIWCVNGASPQETKNPFVDGGCLYQRKENWTKKRVCTSEDPPEHERLGYCVPNDFDYMEIRIASQNWESAFFETWILQVVLSEILGVPTSVETAVENVKVDFYDPEGRFEYGLPDDFTCMERAREAGGDCTLVIQRNADEDNEEYQCCFHFVPEVWEGDDFYRVEDEGLIEPSSGMGTIGEEFWLVPKFTAERDPTLLSYVGLSGEKNRQKLADRFERPVRWGDYCRDMSQSNCTETDDVATRAPRTSEEADMFFSDPDYTGHFRKTWKNDCVANPTNCTGHVMDYPCGWTTYLIPQIYHLGIALDLDGREPGSGGYTYGELVQIFYASNHTKSDIIAFWWTPEALYQQFLGTDMEFTQIVMPPVTKECLDNRITASDRCTDDLKTRVGSPLGSCDEAPHALSKATVEGLYETIYSEEIPPPLYSPGYDVLKLYQISGTEAGQMFDYWTAKSDRPREAICDWMIDNFEILERMVPRDYPRTLEKNSGSLNYPLSISSITLASLAVAAVVAACFMTFFQRNRAVIKHAQIEFLCMLLAGLFMVSIGAMLTSLPPSNGICLAAVWTTNVGYSLELVPLIVKMAAFYRLMRAAKRMRHVELRLRSLYGAVFGLTLIVVIFLVVWSLVDPPQKEAEYKLTDKTIDTNEVIVSSFYYCDSQSQAWSYASVGWHLLLLVTATIQAFQTRSIRKEINESQTLAIMIYSHFVFVLLRLVTLFLEETIKNKELMLVTSLIFSLDAIATIMIYFVPKFLTKTVEGRQSDVFMESSTVKQLQMLAAIATSQQQFRLSKTDSSQESSVAGRRFSAPESALTLLSRKKELRGLTEVPSLPGPHTGKVVSSGGDSMMTAGLFENDTANACCQTCDDRYCCPTCGETSQLLGLTDLKENDSTKSLARDEECGESPADKAHGGD